ncbi:hypothetical protein BDV41DRAFT_565672 [Aspergillus transmontanensis]|uniref:Uncharacterized protein n=1 Tax=Aspergillus transmontanensis TaxID=1034304 RepID=A0A5N6VT97_9EURO|nr:hypothetical protein BDV41DRAFT_565672 [Aspergillus transmontanensis]
MHYVYYASLYTVWALMPVGIPDREWWAEMAKFLEECLVVIQFSGDDRFKIKKVNPVVDEGEDEGLSEDGIEGSHTDDEDASEVETVIDEEGHATDDGDEEDDNNDNEEHDEEVRENDMAGQRDGHIPEIVIRISMEAGGQGTTFHWDDENGEPTFDDVQYQLWQKVCHDLREIDLKLRGRVYTKLALGFR